MFDAQHSIDPPPENPSKQHQNSNIEVDETFGQDIIDAIKLEVSSLSPFEQQKLETKVIMIQDQLEEAYGQYMTQDKIDKIHKKHPEKRIFIADDNGFVSFYFNWESDLPEPGNENRFSEAGARYYSTRALEKAHLPGLSMPDEDARADVYKRMVEKYGEDVHRLFFGTLNNRAQRMRILTEFEKPSVVEMFSSYNRPADYQETEEDLVDVYGVHESDDVIALRDTESMWGRLNPDARNNLIDEFGSVETAKAMLKQASTNFALAHEIVHIYESEEFL